MWLIITAVSLLPDISIIHVFPKSAEKHETNNNHVFQKHLVNVGAQCWRFYFFLILKVIAGSLIVYLVVLDMAQLC